MRRLELGRRDRLDPVLEVEVRHLLPETVLAGRGGGHAVLVDTGLELQRLVLLVLHEVPAGVGIDRLVLLEEATLGSPDDAAGLLSVQDQVAVAALQAQADPLGDPEGDRWGDEEEELQRPGCR